MAKIKVPGHVLPLLMDFSGGSGEQTSEKRHLVHHDLEGKKCDLISSKFHLPHKYSLKVKKCRILIGPLIPVSLWSASSALLNKLLLKMTVYLNIPLIT